MDQLKSKGKSFEIWKGEVWEAYLKVKENRGAPGMDGQSLDDFEADLKGNLYRIRESDVVGDLVPATGAGGGDTQAARSRYPNARHPYYR